MLIQLRGIITRDKVSVDVSTVAYYRVEDAVRSAVAIENVSAAINQIAQTTLCAVIGVDTLDETLSETDTISQNIRAILDVQTEECGVKVTTVELSDTQLPESMQRATAHQVEAEREKRAIGVDNDYMIEVPAPLMSTIGKLGVPHPHSARRGGRVDAGDRAVSLSTRAIAGLPEIELKRLPAED